jgi:dihydrofolate reductase
LHKRIDIEGIDLVEHDNRDEVLTHQALLLGRNTYESFAAAWQGAFADKMNSVLTCVASTTLSLHPLVVFRGVHDT